MKTGIFAVLFLTLFTFSGRAQDFWQKVADLNHAVRTFGFDNSGNIYAGTLGGGVFRSSNSGDNWSQTNSGITDLNINSIVCNSSGMVFAGTSSSGVFKSTDNGNTWNNTSLNSGTIHSLAANSNGYVFAGSNSGIYRSSDNGVNWIRALDSLTVYSIVSKDNGYVVVLTSLANSVFRSPDNGVSWQLREFSYNFNSFGLAPNGVIFATTGGEFDALGFYLHSSGDDAYSWGYLYNFGSASQRVAINDPGDVFVSRGNGMWVSSTSGMSGTYQNSGLNLGGGLILGIVVSPDNIVFAGQENGFVYRNPASPTGIQTGNLTPSSYSLYQNYPNPFNPATRISYDIPQNSFVKLVVFDVLGKEVATLVNGIQKAGSYNVSFEASNLPSGVYFFKLTADGFTDTKKMVLMK